MELTAHLHELIIGVVVAIASGGLLGAWFTHNRELPKARAEARNMDWQRFQNEIARLDRKLEAQEKRIEELEREVANCHEVKEAQAYRIEHLEQELARHERQDNAGNATN